MCQLKQSYVPTTCVLQLDTQTQTHTLHQLTMKQMPPYVYDLHHSDLLSQLITHTHTHSSTHVAGACLSRPCWQDRQWWWPLDKHSQPKCYKESAAGKKPWQDPMIAAVPSDEPDRHNKYTYVEQTCRFWMHKCIYNAVRKIKNGDIFSLLMARYSSKVN